MKHKVKSEIVKNNSGVWSEEALNIACDIGR